MPPHNKKAASGATAAAASTTRKLGQMSNAGNIHDGTKRASFVDTFNQQVLERGNDSFRSSSEKEGALSYDMPNDNSDYDDDDDDDDVFISKGRDVANATKKNKHQDSTSSESNSQSDAAWNQQLRALKWGRWTVGIVLLLTSVGVTLGIYVVLQRQQALLWQSNYDLVAQSIQDRATEHMAQFRHAMTTLSWTVTSAGATAAATTSTAFPMVTVPQFELAARALRNSASDVDAATSGAMLASVVATTWNPIVPAQRLEEWSNYTANEFDHWYAESTAVNQALAVDSTAHRELAATNAMFRSTVWNNDAAAIDTSNNSNNNLVYAPIWQSSPPPVDPMTIVNYNLLSDPIVASSNIWSSLNQERDGVTSPLVAGSDLINGRSVWASFLASADSTPAATAPYYALHFEPVFATLNDRSSPIVGFLSSMLDLQAMLTRVLLSSHASTMQNDKVQNMAAMLQNTCGQALSFEVVDNNVQFLGAGLLVNSYNLPAAVEIPLPTRGQDETKSVGEGNCQYTLTLYSTGIAPRNDDMILQCTLALAAAFVLLTAVWCLYDGNVRRRNMEVVTAAARSNAIISSLFPSQVRDRLFAEKGGVAGTTVSSRPGGAGGAGGAAGTGAAAPKTKLKTMLNSGSYVDAHSNDNEIDAQGLLYDSKPIADLFPETTILFADIAGFTAWSSVREPSQVFILLETLYRAFDDIAKRRRVFKVETIGDCYVAVTGLPDPRKDHAVAMARFSRDCMTRMRSLCKQLEVTLGPDTGDLAMRMGIHSGPVTAGVLRGERSRFQLFGDTMNTAARMEHTGLRDKIQVSQETADLLIAAGKSSWLSKREDVIVAKGKGEMHTYWLEVRGNSGSVVDVNEKVAEISRASCDSVSVSRQFDSKTMRLVEWNVDVLLRSLKQIVARRKACPIDPSEFVPPNEARYSVKHGLNTLDEVMEVITLPKFKEAKDQERPESVTFDTVVVDELREFVCQIAAMYRENPFHNFEHASHVSMSVVKLLSRIIAPNQVESEDLDVFLYHEDESDQSKKVASMLHDHTYGITSDPLTQFSCVLSALIHDVDHAGVPNAQLVNENATIAQLYKNKSVAEQNSVDLAWNLLMGDNFKTLRRTIYETDDELRRFRQLVVNSVMATDIVDKTLKTLRNLRWDRAFSQSTQSVDANTTVSVNRKATIVIEHLIQASDVAHTMQHWHVYRKWNERFFLECHQAYRDGRSDKNPAEGWYEGELGFYDFYIIPLAKKLKDCGVFGVSSDEYLQYALKNRQEWETRGREVVNEMIEMVAEKQGGVEKSQDF